MGVSPARRQAFDDAGGTPQRVDCSLLPRSESGGLGRLFDSFARTREAALRICRMGFPWRVKRTG
ncbi:hypothetical protein TRIP_B220026 [uncultured Desulfatiglans sp.]|uniref:Uncharacterized protein n=1 Tax=Uncultured Desulfatiglans sp. TaxID=1748965 RepID=A0A653A4A9_UNCDX|nr:hypothetical protein TRIP_B220026 [uncultured Desulfatiglans sp.]